ncbi:MAG: trigger factor [Candidatus Omnitrophota bacterium]|jgi:trigger factor
MKVKSKDLGGSRRGFEIEVPADHIKNKYEEIIGEIEKYAEVPGYRVGKAPRYLVETHYKDKAGEEVKKRLIGEAVMKAVKDAGIDMIGMPSVTDIIFEAEKQLSFKAEVHVRPEVKLKNYKGLKAVRQKAQVATEDVDKVIEDLQERHSQLKDVEGRPAKENDWCLCDVEISVEAKPGEKNENVWFPLNPKSTKPEFMSQLLGAVPGDTRTVNTIMPLNYPRKEQAGKQAVFIITVNQVKEKIAPAIDDEFAKDVGGFKSLLELRGNIREELTKAKEQEARFKVEEDLVGQLIKGANFEAPEMMVDTEAEHLLKDAQNRLQYMGYKKEDIEKEEAAMKQKFRDEAVRRVKSYFILDKIAELEKLAASEEDISKRVELLAARAKKTAEEAKKYLEENNLMEDIKAEISQDKAMEFLIENAKIEEV